MKNFTPISINYNLKHLYPLLMFHYQLHVKRDVLIYDGFNFIADFGGYMGILLGFSILSIFDVISNWILINMSHIWMNFRNRYCQRSNTLD
jgi:hypothetical protein